MDRGPRVDRGMDCRPAGPGLAPRGHRLPDADGGESADAGLARGRVLGEFAAADRSSRAAGRRDARRGSAARDRGVAADGPVRAGAGLHQRPDSEKVRERGSGVLRIAGVLRPSAPGTRGSGSPADRPGGGSGQPDAKRRHAGGHAGGIDPVWTVAAGCPAGEHAAGALRGDAIRAAAAPVEPAHHGRPAAGMVLRLAALGGRRGGRGAAVRAPGSFPGWPSRQCAGNCAAKVWDWPRHRAGRNWRRA